MITPEQCRAARGLLNWSQEELDQRSAVSKKTIVEFEGGGQIPFEKTLRQIELALEAGGVQFIPANGGGAGVRLKVAVPRLVRKRASRFDRLATIAIHYKGAEYKLRLSTDILDDIDRTNYSTDVEYERSIDFHMNQILLTGAAAIDTSRTDDEGLVVLTPDDFPEVGSPLRKKSAKLRFAEGERYISKRAPHKIAEVMQVEDDGRKAWVDVRTMNNVLLTSNWVVYAQFINNWSLT